MFNMKTLTRQIERLQEGGDSEAEVDSDGMRIQYIYYISEGSVIKARKDNPDSRTVITRQGATHLNVDAANQVMYYVLNNRQLVSESMMQGSNPSVIVNNIGAVGDVKFDAAAGIIYFSDTVQGTIESYNTVTGNRYTLYQNLQYPNKLSFTKTSGYVPKNSCICVNLRPLSFINVTPSDLNCLYFIHILQRNDMDGRRGSYHRAQVWYNSRSQSPDYRTIPSLPGHREYDLLPQLPRLLLLH